MDWKRVDCPWYPETFAAKQARIGRWPAIREFAWKYWRQVWFSYWRARDENTATTHCSRKWRWQKPGDS